MKPTPPRCPQFQDAPDALRCRYLEYVGEQTAAANADADRDLVSSFQSASHLAADLHVAGVGLCHSRATEFSNDIFWLFHCAAVVALFTGGKHSVDFLKYAKDVRHYRDSVQYRQEVEAFENFVTVAIRSA